MDIGPTELLIILFLVVLIFGPGRLSKVGGELGKAIRSFREGFSDQDDDKKTNPEENNLEKRNSSDQNYKE